MGNLYIVDDFKFKEGSDTVRGAGAVVYDVSGDTRDDFKLICFNSVDQDDHDDVFVEKKDSWVISKNSGMILRMTEGGIVGGGTIVMIEVEGIISDQIYNAIPNFRTANPYMVNIEGEMNVAMQYDSQYYGWFGWYATKHQAIVKLVETKHVVYFDVSGNARYLFSDELVYDRKTTAVNKQQAFQRAMRGI